MPKKERGVAGGMPLSGWEGMDLEHRWEVCAWMGHLCIRWEGSTHADRCQWGIVAESVDSFFFFF